ncbi:chemotaxis response regulator protein-glutamate methylesterase [Permianibacter sp. IMCC34836]|uniref:protein-glutamate methylesterase/protein-glutamine glutaminase n=1 Tax=Permianibacter fluminis TaxID=2738515 RepID=UPI001552A25A|nr:chemotaxis response regulator protein-glutamate methylesterase [Permianibacter fluminis]NQD36152.1 chemotaxis response regulator protein-glutamate methylesterase [Permianibacter fluminis]
MSIRVMIVDDSAVVRQVLQQQLDRNRDIEIIATAPDPIFALEKLKSIWPDVLIVDIEMPRMDGLTFLRQIMATRPTPVIICSTLTEAGADITLQALSAGAFAIITKPKTGLRDYIVDSSEDLASVVREAAAARMDRMRTAAPTARAAVQKGEPLARPKLTADEILAAPSGNMNVPMTEKFIAIGCSTGGTQALEVVLTALPRTSPGIVVVQHMPEQFTRSFASRLNTLSQIEVKEAETGDRIMPGRALIAPGGKHLLAKRSGAQYYAEVMDGPLVSRHRPSVDVLFRSVAKSAGQNAIGIIMTGMGDDGARGMKEMHEAGCKTYAQDEQSCVVFGMPKEAIKLGGVDEVVSLDEIPRLITAVSRRQLGQLP